MSKLMPFHCICLLIDEDFAILRFSVNYGSPKGTSVLTLNQSLFFSKIGVCFLENRGLNFGNRSLSLLKIGVCSFQNRSWPQVLRCHSALEFEQNQWRIQGGSRGARRPVYF